MGKNPQEKCLANFNWLQQQHTYQGKRVQGFPQVLRTWVAFQNLMRATIVNTWGKNGRGA